MQKIFSSIDENKQKLNKDFYACSDFMQREAKLLGTDCLFCAMDGLINSLTMSELVVSPILSIDSDCDGYDELFDEIKLSAVNSVEMQEVTTFDDMYFYLMSGFCAFMLDGVDRAIVCGIQGWEKRAPDEPSNENNVKGAKECFVECINDNKALLRRRLKTNHLKLKQLKLGTSAKTQIVIAYVDNVADRHLVDEVESRINKSGLATVVDFGELIPFLDTDIKTVFSGVGSTERPDTLASKLMEGRVAVLVDGTPFALFVPSLFSDNFQSVDDYNNPPFYATFIRVIRYLSFAVSIFLPAVYVAVGTFHQELIPTALLFTVASEEITTPFSLTVEAIMLLLLYEVMREAGLRLPRAIGHAVSIIGGIVIGQTTVEAGITGAPMLVVIAMTAISSYIVYQLYESVSVLRFVFIIIGGLFGMYGIILGACVMCINICAVNPYGIALSLPITPFDVKYYGDIIYRQDWRKLSKSHMKVNKLRGADIDSSKE